MQYILMKITATQLRQNIYKLLDSVVETGVPLEVERNGVILKIIAEHPQDKLKNIKAMPHLITGSPESLEDIDWSIDLSEEWKNDLP